MLCRSGRDVPPQVGATHIHELELVMDELGLGKIATVSGRYYAMDRDKRWERTQLYYDAMTLGKGILKSDPVQAVEDSYKEGVFDEFMLPSVMTKDGLPIATVDSGDSIIFFNFRPDRARQITRAFCDDDFAVLGFDPSCYLGGRRSHHQLLSCHPKAFLLRQCRSRLA